MYPHDLLLEYITDISDHPSTDLPSSNDNIVHKVNPSEFDPLQEKKQTIETPKDVAQGTPKNHDSSENRPQSVPVVPTPPMPASASNQNPQISDYYGRSQSTGIFVRLHLIIYV